MDPSIPHFFLRRKLWLLVMTLFCFWQVPAHAGLWESLQADPGLTLKAYAGEAAAQNALGRLYFGGQGVHQNDAEALAWWQKAAAHNNADAQTNLGALYDQGRAVPLDKEQAQAWWLRAADQGNVAAEINLLSLEETGAGLPEDDRTAVTWYRSMALQGNPLAQYMLSRRYAVGRGVTTDSVRAFAWTMVAAKNGSTRADSRLLELEASLTSDDIHAARAWADACRAARFTDCD